MSKLAPETRCAVCGEPVDPDVAHMPHEPDCPVPALRGRVPGAGEARDALAACQCAAYVHPECCWECER
jgi:hypothetical protein